MDNNLINYVGNIYIHKLFIEMSQYYTMTVQKHKYFTLQYIVSIVVRSGIYF